MPHSPGCGELQRGRCGAAGGFKDCRLLPTGVITGPWYPTPPLLLLLPISSSPPLPNYHGSCDPASSSTSSSTAPCPLFYSCHTAMAPAPGNLLHLLLYSWITRFTALTPAPSPSPSTSSSPLAILPCVLFLLLYSSSTSSSLLLHAASLPGLPDDFQTKKCLLPSYSLLHYSYSSTPPLLHSTTPTISLWLLLLFFSSTTPP